MKNSNFNFFQKFIDGNYEIKNNINISWTKINEHLIAIENKLKENTEFDLIPIYGRRIVEALLKYMCMWANKDDTGSNIKNLLEVFKDERISHFRKIKSSFSYIIDKGNETAHSNNSSLNKCEVTVIAKDLRICLLFFIEKILNVNDFVEDSNILFDETIYFDKNINNEIITKKEINENHIIFEKTSDDINVNMIEIVSFLLGKNRKFEVPMYQRGYDWDDDNIEEFLDDILLRYKDKKTHYFGIVACKKEKINNEDIIKILDGQQRLTTSLIFIKAIKDFYFYKFNKQIYKENDYNSYQKFFYPSNNNKTILFSELITNITNIRDQNEKFHDILGKSTHNEIKEKYDNEESKKQYKVINSYFKIINWLEELLKTANDNHEDVISAIALTFISKFEIGLIQFDEQKFKLKQELEIFENLNSKGKSLSIIDLVKNYLFSLCDEKILSNDNNAEEINKLFKEEINEKFNNENESTEFLSLFVHLFSRKEQNSKKKSKFLGYFKEVIDTKINWNLLINNYNDKIENIDIETYTNMIKIISIFISTSYNKIKKIKEDETNYDHIEHSLNLLIRTINKKKLTPLFAIDFLIVYFVIKKEKLNEKKINQLLTNYKKEIYKIYLIAIKYMIISYIKTGQGDSKLKRTIFEVCNDIIKLINDGLVNSMEEIAKELKHRLFNNKTSKEEMIDLLNKHDDRIKTFSETLFMLIEINKREKHKSKYPTELFGNNKHTIEHIMPKDPSKWEKDIKEWNNIPYSKNHKEFKQKHNDHVNKIGNLLLIAKGLNSSIKNDIFNKKIKTYDEFANELFLYKNEENKKIDISKKDKWSFIEIDDRTNEIKQYIVYEIFNDCLE